MTVSVLMVLVLILGITINKLEVFGVEITFGRAQLLMALMVANVYLTISYTVQSLHDQTEHARIFDIASHDELVGKPTYDRLEAAIADIATSKRLTKEARNMLVMQFTMLASLTATPPGGFDEMRDDDAPDDNSARLPKVNEIGLAITGFCTNVLSPHEPELAGRLRTHAIRIQRRADIYTTARLESFIRARGLSSLSTLLPTMASTILTCIAAYGLYDPSFIAWFQEQLQSLEAVFAAGGLPPEPPPSN
ncbi:MAG: hypothetical protein AAGH70_04800 [Pseudomonadota bacterium]